MMVTLGHNNPRHFPFIVSHSSTKERQQTWKLRFLVEKERAGQINNRE